MPGAGLGSHLHCFSCLHLVIKMSSLYNPFCAWRLIHIWDTVLWWLFCLVLLYWWFSFWHQYPLKSSLYCCRFLFLCSLVGFRGNLWTKLSAFWDSNAFYDCISSSLHAAGMYSSDKELKISIVLSDVYKRRKHFK